MNEYDLNLGIYKATKLCIFGYANFENNEKLLQDVLYHMI